MSWFKDAKYWKLYCWLNLPDPLFDYRIPNLLVCLSDVRNLYISLDSPSPFQYSLACCANKYSLVCCAKSAKSVHVFPCMLCKICTCTPLHTVLNLYLYYLACCAKSVHVFPCMLCKICTYIPLHVVRNLYKNSIACCAKSVHVFLCMLCEICTFMPLHTYIQLFILVFIFSGTW